MSVFLTAIVVLQLVSYVPQIVKLLRTKKGEDLSLSSWSMWLLVDLSWVLPSWFYTKDLGQTLVAGVELLLVLCVFVLTLYFKRVSETSCN